MADIYLNRKMLQICIIAKDCTRLNENWAKLLGKKFAGLSRYEGSKQTLKTEYMGEMVSGLGLETNTFDLAAGDKSIQFEIMAALNGPSEWYNFMTERNQGIHHIAFSFEEDDFIKGLDDLKKNTGMDRVQKGSPYATPEASYAYLATKKNVGSTVEILGFGGMGDQAAEYRRISALMSSLDAKDAPFARMVPADVTLITQDMDRSVSEFMPLFGEKAPKAVEQKISGDFGGQENVYEALVCDLDMISTHLRFLQPVKGSNAWQEFADDHQDGLYSIAFNVEDIESKLEQLKEFNLPVYQKGYYSDGTEYVLLDGREDYAAIIELRTSPSIVKELQDQKNQDGLRCHEEYAINERTPLNELLATEERCKVFMVSEKMIDFGVDEDGEEKKANLFFTLSATNPDEHLDNIGQLVEIFTNEPLLDALAAARTPEDILKAEAENPSPEEDY